MKPALLAVLLLAGCSTARNDPDDGPSYRDGVGELLRAKCAGCHAGLAPPAGWRADSFESAVGCVASGQSVLTGPLSAALHRPDHADIVTTAERELIERWASAGGLAVRPGTHDRAFTDPRSPASHGNLLRARRYRPMLDANDEDACGKCHDGVVAKPSGFAFAAPGATSCTTCHADAGGTLACTTCHGTWTPRDPCFHPEYAGDRAHPAHTRASASRTEGLACATCHPQPVLGDVASPTGTHANGWVEVWFDYALAGREAKFDATSKQCSGTCHARGGNREAPAWPEAVGRALDCNDCHRSPPLDHYAGECSSCHRAPERHVNGRVDLGDGSGKCGACHGDGDSPWPKTGAHLAHRAPAMSKAVSCETCHDVPQPGDRHPLGRGRAEVRLLGQATAGGRRATFDPATRRCADTNCHGGPGAEVPAPRWNDGPSASACGSCHATPPPDPHPQSATCETCHGTMTAATHVDGIVTR